MKNKCVNYGVWLMIAWPLLGILFSLGLLFASVLLAVILFLLCVTVIVIYVMIEPTSYVIDEKGLSIVCGFKKTFLSWDEIPKIELHYDPIFRMPFLKHYVIYRKNCGKLPKRKECIIKTNKTSRLLKAYFPGRITAF